MPSEQTGDSAAGRYYRLNSAALTWREIRAAQPTVLPWLLAIPLYGIYKLLRKPLLSAQTYPCQHSFEPADPQLAEQRYAHIGELARALTRIGFEHVSTYRTPEWPDDSVTFVFLNRREWTYAQVLHCVGAGGPVPDRVSCTFDTPLADGGSLQTGTLPGLEVLAWPPRHRRQTAPRGSLDDAWLAHRGALREVAREVGGVRKLEPDDYGAELIARGREFEEFQFARGVYAPDGEG